jgi:hypothetical protein
MPEKCARQRIGCGVNLPGRRSLACVPCENLPHPSGFNPSGDQQSLQT